MTGVLLTRGQGTQKWTDTLRDTGKPPHDVEGRDWSNEALHHRTARITGNTKS